MEQQKMWHVKRIVTTVVLSIVAAGILFVALFFPIKAAYYLSGDRGGGRFVIFTDNLGREYRVDLPKGEKKVEGSIELDYDLDTYYTFTYKVYYTESGKFTGEQGGYGYSNPHVPGSITIGANGGVESGSKYAYTVYGGGEEFSDDNLVKAYAEYYDANGKVKFVAEIGMRVNLKNARPIPKLRVFVDKPGKYEDFLWKNYTAADYRIKPGEGSYQVTVPEGWVFDVRDWDEEGNYIGEKVGRTCRFAFDKDTVKLIWIYREDPENTERHFWVEVTETFNQDADYVPEAVTAPYSGTMHVTRYSIEQLTFTPTASGIYEMKLDNENVEYLVTDGDMSSGEYEKVSVFPRDCDLGSRYLEKGKTYNIYFQTKQKDEEINFSLKACDTLSVESDYSKTVDGYCVLAFVPQGDGNYEIEVNSTVNATIEYVTYENDVPDYSHCAYNKVGLNYCTLENLKAEVPCYIYIRLDNPANITCRIAKA